LESCGTGCVDVYFVDVANLEIAGFQFDITGAEVTGLGGGKAEDADFELSFSSSTGTVLGFSLAGDSFGCDSDEMNDDGACHLVTVYVDGDEACIEDAIISDENADSHPTSSGDCVTLGACDPNGDVNFDGELNVLDAVQIVNEILEPEWDSDQCEFVTADVSEDGNVDVLDVVAIINDILDA
jgi:hypothetical protein